MLRLEPLKPVLVQPGNGTSEPLPPSASGSMQIEASTDTKRNLVFLRPGDRVWLRETFLFTVNVLPSTASGNRDEQDAARGQVQVNSSIPQPETDEEPRREPPPKSIFGGDAIPSHMVQVDRSMTASARSRGRTPTQGSGPMIEETPATSRRHVDVLKTASDRGVSSWPSELRNSPGVEQDDDETMDATATIPTKYEESQTLSQYLDNGHPIGRSMTNMSDEDADGLLHASSKGAKVERASSKRGDLSLQGTTNESMYSETQERPSSQKGNSAAISKSPSQDPSPSFATAQSSAEPQLTRAAENSDNTVSGVELVEAKITPMTDEPPAEPNAGVMREIRRTFFDASEDARALSPMSVDETAPKRRGRKRKSEEQQAGPVSKKIKIDTIAEHGEAETGSKEDDDVVVVGQLPSSSATKAGKRTPKAQRKRAIKTSSQPTPEGVGTYDKPWRKRRIAFSNSSSTTRPTVMTFFASCGMEEIDRVTPGGGWDVLVVGDGDVKKTSKLLLSLLLEKTITTDSWLSKSASVGKVLDPAAYTPPDLELEIDRRQLFKGKTIFVTPSLKKDYGSSGFKEVQDLARLAGAEAMVSKTPRTPKDVEGMVVLGLGKDDLDSIGLMDKGVECYSRELLSTSILRGSLDLGDDEFKLVRRPSQQARKGKGKGRRS